jgi:hypothetical protein
VVVWECKDTQGNIPCKIFGQKKSFSRSASPPTQ